MKLNPGLVIGAVLVLGVGGWFVGRSLFDTARADAHRDELLHAAQAALAATPDSSEALKLARAGLDVFPDDSGLLLVHGIALVRRGRFTDAEGPLEQVARLSTDASSRDEAEFYVAAARLSRFLGTKDRGDLNLGRAAVARAAGGGSHASYAHLLLGCALAIPGAQRDPKQALEHLEAGLASPPQDEPIDLGKIKALADDLRTELSGTSGS